MAEKYRVIKHSKSLLKRCDNRADFSAPSNVSNPFVKLFYYAARQIILKELLGLEYDTAVVGIRVQNLILGKLV